MTQNNSLSTELSQNIDLLHRLLPLGKSFDLITRDLRLGETPAFWLGINGFCNTEILQQIFSDLQDPHYTLDSEIRDLPGYVQSRLGYAQVSLTSSVDDILQNLLSGPSILLVDGFDQAVIIDVRTYPVRSISEPDTERSTRGARDGFVEMMNEKAQELCCQESHFANPSGLNDESQLTSVYDMALIGRAAYENPALLEIASATSYRLPPTASNPDGVTIRMECRYFLAMAIALSM